MDRASSHSLPECAIPAEQHGQAGCPCEMRTNGADLVDEVVELLVALRPAEVGPGG